MLRAVVQISLLSLLVALTPTSLLSQRLETVEELLKKHHIELTKSSLVKALRDPTPEVRWLAAQKLANDHATDTVSAIKEALDSDWHLPKNRVNIAYALAQLEDPKGLQTLQFTCGDSEFNAYQRLIAARYVLDLGKGFCFNDVLSILQNEDDAGSRIEALSLLPQFDNLSEDDRRKTLRLIATSLSDQTPAVRMSAAGVLAALGDRNSIKDLSNAVERERDPAVQNHMRIELKKLEDKVRAKRPPL